ncbi:hypothetical protein ACIBG8_07320 [Nonomuraea sp. NPDC050556]|uniref:hypothetical protein n=1 Tax=Nonomuraea sp. NPDC050556 TaxID=3364369 RepID=UPI0037A11F53
MAERELSDEQRVALEELKHVSAELARFERQQRELVLRCREELGIQARDVALAAYGEWSETTRRRIQRIQGTS